MDEIILFEENNGNIEISFEDFKNKNGIDFWWASQFMLMLGYKTMSSFKNAIDRATKACLTLNLPYYENFIAEQRIIDGKTVQDFKLTRFACYLVAMNADVKKQQVAQAQIYFVEQTRKFELNVQNHEEFERILIRDEIKDGNKALFSVAKQANIVDYAKFSNAGYMGLYNMWNIELAKKRKIDSKDLFDYMGRTELAANLFRITQTEERIKTFNVQGQANLEQTHFKVGREVRDIIQKNTGKNPENLPIEKRIPDIQKELKKGYKKMIKEDNRK